MTTPGSYAILITIFSALLVSCDRTEDPVTQKESKPQPSSKVVTTYDQDGDGELSETERIEMNETFIEHFDTDGDKKLSPKERNEIRSKARVSVSANSKAPVKPEQVGAFLKRFDKDDDGFVSETEAGTDRWRVMKRADKDQNGKISIKEWLERNQK